MNRGMANTDEGCCRRKVMVLGIGYSILGAFVKSKYPITDTQYLKIANR